jgi:hypothetical protein
LDDDESSSSGYPVQLATITIDKPEAINLKSHSTKIAMQPKYKENAHA